MLPPSLEQASGQEAGQEGDRDREAAVGHRVSLREAAPRAVVVLSWAAVAGSSAAGVDDLCWAPGGRYFAAVDAAGTVAVVSVLALFFLSAVV